MRPTQTKTTPSGKEIVLQEYLTARERNTLRDMFYGSMQVSNTGEVENLGGDMFIKAEQQLLKLMVVSYGDAKGEAAVSALLDGKPDDYDFVVEICNGSGSFLAPTNAATTGSGTTEPSEAS